jgi:DNA replication protein DnaC
MEDRHHYKSTIFTSQLPLIEWYEVIGDKTVADAILDRIAHHAHRIELKGESLRKNRPQKSKNN